jgi:hypothetical protein
VHQLKNATLRVDVLDPVAEASRLGPRFCWGGYVWQVHDVDAGPLLRGPHWPAEEPPPFDGQGLPESFRHRTLDGRRLTWRGDQGVALGAGELRADAANGAVSVTKPCTWQLTPFADRLIFSTQHEAAGFSYELARTVELAGRELRSHTKLTNRAEERLTLEWFAHPFFAPGPELARAELPAGTTIADNPGFALAARALTQKRAFVRQNDGHMDRVKLPDGERVVATLPHPNAQIASIRFETSFVPTTCVIWGNDRTFSIEPYLTLDLAPGEAKEWSVSYRFGST